MQKLYVTNAYITPSLLGIIVVRLLCTYGTYNDIPCSEYNKGRLHADLPVATVHYYKTSFVRGYGLSNHETVSLDNHGYL